MSPDSETSRQSGQSSRSEIGLAIYAADGACLQADQVVARAQGAPLAPILEQNFRQDEYWRSTGLLEAAERVLETGASQRLRLASTTPAGTPAWFDHVLTRAEIEGSPYLHLVVIDSTAQVELQRSEARYAELINILEAGVVVHGTDTSIVLSNPAACRILGLTEAQLHGKMAIDPAWSFIYEDGRTMPVEEYPVNRVLSSGRRLSQYLVGINHPERPGPTWVFCNAFPSLTPDGDVEYAIISFVDVTERIQAQKENFRVEKLESLGLLAGGVAHDFNNLLTMIIANLSVLEDEPLVPEPVQEIIGTVLTASERAVDLTRQLLTFAKGGAPVKSVGSLADMISESASFALSGSSCRLLLEIAADLWAAEVDRGQMSQVINNLVINAHQAMPDGGEIRIEAANLAVPGSGEAVPAELEPGRYVRITIEDEGPGIDPQNLDKIFDPFFTTKETGSGLGLATTFSIVKRHLGHIRLHSEPGDGARFDIYIPATTAQPEEIAVKAPRRGSGRILVMDDEELLRKVARGILEKLGYRVETRPDGRSCIEAYVAAREAGDPFDLVLMDLTVTGGMGGKEAVTELRRRDGAVLAIATSGYSNDPVMSDPRSFGFCSTLPKPFNAAKLSSAVASALDNAPTSDL